MLIKDYIKNNLLILDGAMGTMLQNLGLAPGENSEMWNISHPKEVINVHKAYYNSGSNVVSTNTFGVNCLKYDDSTLEMLIEKAVYNCNKARELSKGTQTKFIAFDIGPLGKLLKPIGEIEFENAVEVFSKTVRIANKYNIDCFFIETMNDSYETKAALLAVKENSSLPVFVSNAYGEDGRLVTGATPEVMATMLESMGADAVGVNCSFGPAETISIIRRIKECTSLPVIMKPNAGLPQFIDGKTVFNVSPDMFTGYIVEAVDMGVNIVGGCCGTNPEYIKCVSAALLDKKPQYKEIEKKTVVSSYTHTVVFDDFPILIGERINPTGKKRFKQALLENDLDYILSEGIKQQEKGVHILDVNVGLAGIDECEMLQKTVYELQSICDLPLQLDSSDAAALEKAMRIYNGKPLINSVNGKKSSMDSIFPLVKKYGGAIIALTLDEWGIPSTKEGRIEIAERILAEAEKYGITKNDIIFDPLTMAVSADESAGLCTIETVEAITKKLRCKTSLGVSNISFGLPEREVLNSTFFAMALQKGLSAAIMNPYSQRMMDVYYSYCALNCNDKGFVKYISYFENDASDYPISSVITSDDDIVNAIIKGRKEQAAKIAAIMLKNIDGLKLIDEYIIPALDKTGELFKDGKLYLPQLLMSAEAASMAFDEIKRITDKNVNTKCKIVLATVKGDIHDIGKNIVKLLLENFGFEIIDLGKDVSPETVVDAIVKNNASLVGLSALMTTTLGAMKDTVELVKSVVPDCKVFVGGAVVTEEYAKSISADRYTKDAMDSVRYADSVYSSMNPNI